MNDRFRDGQFPQLRNQIRVSTGYTHAPGGVLRLPLDWGQIPRSETPIQRDVTISPKTKRKGGRPKIRGDL